MKNRHFSAGKNCHISMFSLSNMFAHTGGSGNISQNIPLYLIIDPVAQWTQLICIIIYKKQKTIPAEPVE